MKRRVMIARATLIILNASLMMRILRFRKMLVQILKNEL
jgi:hypothetical protein